MTARPAPDPGAIPAGGAAEDLAVRVARSTAAAGVVGVGIDAVDLERFRSVLERRPRLAHRLFSEGELAYAARVPDPVSRLATRFAAKEAVMKALGVGLWSFRLTDVEVVRDGLAAPTVRLHGAAADLAGARGAWRWHLSLTHTDTVALAVAVAEAAPGPSVRAAGA